ncbi:MAG: NUDIX hydrolase [Parcubacteria group bacterium]|nr:NUDIX hydrolase [Parcubacteria group bacterium]
MPKLKKWKILKSKYILKNKWLRIKQETCKLPNGDTINDYFVKESRGWAAIFALTSDKKVILNRQYKHGCREVVLELPAGGIDKNETPKQCIEREFLEETGYKVDKTEYLGKYIISPTTNTGYGHLFLGFGARKISEPENNPKEKIQVELVEIDKIVDIVKNKEIKVIPSIAFIYKALDALGLIKFSK